MAQQTSVLRLGFGQLHTPGSGGRAASGFNESRVCTALSRVGKWKGGNAFEGLDVSHISSMSTCPSIGPPTCALEMDSSMDGSLTILWHVTVTQVHVTVTRVQINGPIFSSDCDFDSKAYHTPESLWIYYQNKKKRTIKSLKIR